MPTISDFLQQTRMGISNNKNLCYLALTFIVIQFLSCKKEPPSSNRDVFLKTYETEDSNAIAFNVVQENDGGFFLFSAVGSASLVLTRTNKFGNILWEKTILQSNFQQYYLLSPAPWVFLSYNLGDPGHFVAQSGGDVAIFDTTGKLINYLYNDFLNEPFIKEKGNYLSSYCDGLIFNAPHSDNYIYVYDQNLKLKEQDTFPDSKLGPGKVLQFFVNGTSYPDVYKISGTKYPTSNISTTALMKIFAAKMPVRGGNVIQTIIDTNDHIHSDQFTWQANTNDSGEILLGQRTDITSSNTIIYPIAILLDKNLKVIWEKEYQLTTGTMFPGNIKLCNDGGFIITGYIGKTGYGINNLPYVLKIDKNGSKQWDKIIPSLTGTGSFVYGTDLNDGGYALVGTSSQFGNAYNTNRILFVKTDANGNY